VKIISHRGNVYGPGSQCELENVEFALSKKYDVEIDVRVIEDKFFIGHDRALYEMPKEWLMSSTSCRLWFHAKDEKTFEILKNYDVHSFIHDQEPFVHLHTALDTNGFYWLHPHFNQILHERLNFNDIVLDIAGYPRIQKDKLSKFPFAICTDWCDEWNDFTNQIK
jgi:hypothetical protein